MLKFLVIIAFAIQMYSFTGNGGNSKCQMYIYFRYADLKMICILIFISDCYRRIKCSEKQKSNLKS